MRPSNYYVVNVIIRKANDDQDLTPSKYLELFKEFAQSEISGQSSKEKECLIITSAEYTMPGNKRALFGQFVEYTNIDKRKWFNLLKKDIDPDFTIPDHLKANSVKNAFFFFPEIHRFCYAYTSKERISPLNAQNYLNNALTKFLDKNYPGEFYPEINFEKGKETIAEIINAEQVFSLDIKVSYSNDFGKDMKEFFEDDMKKANADDVHIIAKNKNKESLNLGEAEILRGAVEASASHGEVTASVKTGNRRKTIKTIDYPAKFQVPMPALPESIADIFNFFKRLF